jgi:hypothetical protein
MIGALVFLLVVFVIMPRLIGLGFWLWARFEKWIGI